VDRARPRLLIGSRAPGQAKTLGNAATRTSTWVRTSGAPVTALAINSRRFEAINGPGSTTAR
jgi:hypothetical protein